MRVGITILGILAVMATASTLSCRNRTAVNAENSSIVVFELSESVMQTAPRDTLTLGRIRQGEKLSMDFVLKNTGDTPFVIIDISPDCGCTTFGYDREPLRPGDQKILTVSFDSHGYQGYVVKRARIRTSLSAQPYDVFVVADIR